LSNLLSDFLYLMKNSTKMRLSMGETDFNINVNIKEISF
jgi:hypothetical protein